MDLPGGTCGRERRVTFAQQQINHSVKDYYDNAKLSEEYINF